MSDGEAPDLTAFPYRIGRIARAHGLKGELMLQCFRRRDDRTLAQRRLARPMELELSHPDERLEPATLTHLRWIDGSRVILRLTGFEDRDQAEARVGCYVDVDPARLAPELGDEVDRCFGAEAWDEEQGARIGTIEAIRDNGAQALLEIGLDGGGEALVPAVPPILLGIDADGRVLLRPPPGLLEVNR